MEKISDGVSTVHVPHGVPLNNFFIINESNKDEHGAAEYPGWVVVGG